VIDDPTQIDEDDLPLICYSDNSFGFMQWVIRARTKGFYNHCMWYWREGFFATQQNVFEEVTLESYMRRGNKLKFVKILGVNREQNQLILDSIATKLMLPWYKRFYDYVGVLLGQGTGWKWINIPGLDYCSEDVPSHIKKNEKFMESLQGIYNEGLKKFIGGIEKHSSPAELNAYFKIQENRKYTEVICKWDSEDD